jgi:hypothetical protein
MLLRTTLPDFDTTEKGICDALFGHDWSAFLSATRLNLGLLGRARRTSLPCASH